MATSVNNVSVNSPFMACSYLILDENCQCCNGEHNSDAGDANRNNGENRVPSHVLKAQKTNDVSRDYAKKNMLLDVLLRHV